MMSAALSSNDQRIEKLVKKAFGETMGEYFGVAQQPLLVRSAALSNDFAVTYLRCDGPGTGLTTDIPVEPAILLAMQLRPLERHDLWLDGRSQRVEPYQTGALTMLDLAEKPVANLASAYECVQLYLPRTVLNAVSDANDTARIGELPLLNGSHDAMLAHLAQLAGAAVYAGATANSLFLDSLLITVHQHLQARYAGIPVRQSTVRGGLAPWQESRAKQYMEAHLEQNISLIELAALCQLSVSWFGRAFKYSTGMTPHRWLLTRRIARSLALLQNPTLTITEIAHRCGFADHSHFTREFRRFEGVTPAAWRQVRGIGNRLELVTALR